MDALDKPLLRAIRDDIYLGKGYHVLRSFVSPLVLDHIRRFWSADSSSRFRGIFFNKYKDIYLNCRDFSLLSESLDRHFNFFWNQPRDAATCQLAWQLQAVRNLIEGNPPDRYYLPHYATPGEDRWLRYVASYRLVFTRSGGAVPHHTDWDLDHSKVQMSLMLTSFGTDYDSGGMVFYDRDGGSPVNLCCSEQLQAGDLLIFRYAHRHGVDPVGGSNGGCGFGRLLMPLEVVDKRGESKLFLAWKRASANLRLATWSLRAAVGLPHPDPARLVTSHRLLRERRDESYYDEHVGLLMQIAVREGVDPSNVFLHRGLWGRFRVFQDWQVDALERHGLRPHHSFLDIGCGILKLGMALIPYLDDDLYCGIDAVEEYIRLGHVYMREVVKVEKRFQLLADHEFGFERFGREFDFAMAHSVFTHLSFEQIERCLKSLETVMKANGKLIFTFIRSRDTEKSTMYLHDVPMIKSSHRGLDFFSRLGKKYGFTVRHLGSDGHPTQQVCVATFRTRS